MDIVDVAQAVLRDLLCVSQEERVLVCFDTFGQEIACGFVEAGLESVESGIVARFVPICEQRWSTGHKRLHETLQDEIIRSQCLVNCLTEADECTGFRVQLATAASAAGIRVLHMPGVTPEGFVRAVDGTNFLDLQKRGKPLQDILSSGDAIEIHTQRMTGKPCVLKAKLSGRHGRICGAAVKPGEIANLPTGEVFIAPLEEASEGELVVNGASDECVFDDKDNALLVFEHGMLNLERSNFAPLPSALRLRGRLYQARTESPVHLILCEIGIGLNTTITRLVGDEIWDEKADGTAHIAIGANKPFGGKIGGNYHRDMVFYPKTILVDGRRLDIQFKKPRARKNR